MNGQRKAYIVFVGAYIAVCLISSFARGVVWNGDRSDLGVTSANGLTNRIGYFSNVHTIWNQTNSTRGTALYLANGWVLTARHMVQNGGNYGQLAPPGQIYFQIFSNNYYGSQILTPDGGSEIALVKLTAYPSLSPLAWSIVYPGWNETNKIVQIGGYGLYGWIGTSSLSSNILFHRAYNITWVSGGQLKIKADGEAILKNLGLLEGIGRPGDSGSPLFLFDSTDYTQLDNWNLWKLAGITATATVSWDWGAESNYTRVASYYNWLVNTVWLPEPAWMGVVLFISTTLLTLQRQNRTKQTARS